MRLEYEELGNGYLVTLKYEEQKISGGVSDLLEFIKANPGERTADFMNAFRASKRTIERWLKQLKDDHQIVFRGASKTGGYYIRTK